MIAEDSSLSAPLANMSLKSFIKSVGSRTPAPGGGSVAAAVGAMVGTDKSYISCLNPAP